MKTIEVPPQIEQRRRRSVEEKLAIARVTFESGAAVSGVARHHQVNANRMYAWRKLYQDGSLSAVSAGDTAVSASDVAEALKWPVGRKEEERIVQTNAPPLERASSTGRVDIKEMIKIL